MANIQPRYDKNGKLISYSIRVFRGRDADGKQLKPWTMTYEVSPNQKEDAAYKKALTEAAKFEKDCKEGKTSDSRRKFSDYANYVIELKESRGAKHSTIVWYKEQLPRINEEIGHIRLKDLRADDLNRLYTKLSKTNIQPTSARSIIDLPSLLKEKHITRGEIARRTKLLENVSDVSENTVCLAIRGENCSVKTATAICEVLGLKLEKTFLVLNENKSLSAKTVSGYHRLISAVLTQAVKEGLIPFNVAANAEIPKQEKKEVKSLQSADLSAILSALKKESLKWQTIIHLLMVTGCRRGEILGLRWPDVDFSENRLHICNNVLYFPDVGTYQDSVKTESSVRWISVPSETMDLLTEWKKAQKAEAKKKPADFYHNPDQLLFTQEDGSPMCPDSLTTWLNRFSEKNHLPHVNPHKFRHTMASLLIYNKVDPVSVSKRLGHSQVSTTTDIYAHAIAEADKQNADLIGKIYLANN